MKKIMFMSMALLLVACTSPNYDDDKKISIRPIEKVEEVPAPVVVTPKEIVIPKVIKITLDGVANFNTDQSKILIKDTAKLNEFMDIIKDLDGTLRVEGHTDSRGSASYNQKLSKKRAQAVMDYLDGKLELEKYEKEVVGLGETKLLVEEKTNEDRAKNRRVEIHFIQN